MPQAHSTTINKAPKAHSSMEARIDKWLWAARIYKTRTMAADACKKGQVTIGGAKMKPSKMVREGDVVEVRKPPVTYSFRVLQCIEKRVGARLIPDVLENVTPREQYELLEMSKISGFVGRAKGLGRPTKKDRRDIDAFEQDMPVFGFEFDFDEEEETESSEDSEAG